MSDERPTTNDQRPTADASVGRWLLVTTPSCTPDASGRCATCADEALPARVLSVDAEAGLALVELSGATGEVDITLVDDVAPGAWLLVHGGVALARLGAAPAEGA